MAEVIDLSDDDNDIVEVPVQPQALAFSKKRNRTFKCLNPDCRSSINLIRASASAKRYFGVDSYPKKTRICLDCMSIFRTDKRKIVELIRNGTNVVADSISLYRKTVIFPDSDSDKSDDANSSGQSEYEYEANDSLSPIPDSQECFSDDHVDIRHVVANVIKKFNLRNHISEGSQMIDNKLRENESHFKNLESEYNFLGNEIQQFTNNLYGPFLPNVKYEETLDIGPISNLQEIINNKRYSSSAKQDNADIIEENVVTNTVFNIPVSIPFIRLLPKINDKVYLMSYSKLSKWVVATIKIIDTSESEAKYTVSYYKEDGISCDMKIVKGNTLAYFDKCSARIPVGTRIIAVNRFQKDESFYLGIAAEQPSATNGYRYLVFFDGGYARYEFHDNIRVVVSSSTPVWKDVIEESQEFIKNYLDSFPERPMLRTQKYEFVRTELEGKWLKAQVLRVDASLIKINFITKNKIEWIYRGSTRLHPLLMKKISMKIKSENPSIVPRRRNRAFGRTRPVVEYCTIYDDDEDLSKSQLPDSPEKQQTPVSSNGASHSVEGEGSTGAQALSDVSHQHSILENGQSRVNNQPPQQSIVSSLPLRERLKLECEGYEMSLKLDSSFPEYVQHKCNESCIKNELGFRKNKEHSPTLIPILIGFRRLLVSMKKLSSIEQQCVYVAPCGRRLRSIKEVWRYLRITKSSLYIDQFSFNQNVDLLRSWTPFAQNIHLKDISNGLEDVFISCVNGMDSSLPPVQEYLNVRLPSQNVALNLNPDFLVCCNCTDNCSTSNCQCRKLTVDAADIDTTEMTSNIGYFYRRLFEQVVSGIFECNSKCRCNSSCLNRVVQHPIRQKLQVFKTAEKGWGIRTLNDIPKGGFVCVYVGCLITEEEANESGRAVGADDYFADLDFIEIYENKPDYESDVEDPEDSAFDDIDYLENVPLALRLKKRKKVADNLPDRRFQPNSEPDENHKRNYYKRKVSSNHINNADHVEESRDGLISRCQSFEPTQEVQDKSYISNLYQNIVRDYYNSTDNTYVMDAKNKGNIGRYFNHSCQPNIFVQNVFVDTHDPRFPWLSFFAMEDIVAGTELTWDYNYDVGSVPGKYKHCYCRGPNCRGRLL